jgi:hypothetical protein
MKNIMISIFYESSGRMKAIQGISWGSRPEFAKDSPIRYCPVEIKN